MKTEKTIPGFDTTRKWVLTDGQEIIQTAQLYDWEAVDANKRAKNATDSTWTWILADDKSERLKKLPKALKHKDTGAVEYINNHGTYRAKGLNGSAYGYEEHYKIGYRPINIFFHDFVVGVTFDSKSPDELRKEGLINDLEGYREDYDTGYIISGIPWL